MGNEYDNVYWPDGISYTTHGVTGMYGESIFYGPTANLKLEFFINGKKDGEDISYKRVFDCNTGFWEENPDLDYAGYSGYVRLDKGSGFEMIVFPKNLPYNYAFAIETFLYDSSGSRYATVTTGVYAENQPTYIRNYTLINQWTSMAPGPVAYCLYQIGA